MRRVDLLHLQHIVEPMAMKRLIDQLCICRICPRDPHQTSTLIGSFLTTFVV